MCDPLFEEVMGARLRRTGGGRWLAIEHGLDPAPLDQFQAGVAA